MKQRGITRRDLGRAALGASALGGASAIAAPEVNRNKQPRNYVLVHGTWHGGWAWVHVAEHLRAAGHRVFTPTCTGCGERRHLITPETGLETHIQDIVNAIEWEELGQVILVGHSFAGTTITGVADRLRSRIRHLIFMDALIPTETRRAGVMRNPETGEYPQAWLDRVAKFEDGYKMNFWDSYPAKMVVPENDSENIAWMKRRLTWHPMRQWTDELSLENGGWEGLPRTCIHCVGQVYNPSSEAMVGPGRKPGWNFIELDVARNGFMTDPRTVAECFMSIG